MPHHDKPKGVSMAWLVATHGLLCLTALLMHLGRYPLHHSLYYWWMVPFDAAALLLVSPLYVTATTAPAGFCLNLIISGTETIALVFLGVLNLKASLPLETVSQSEITSALLVAARIPLGWYLSSARSGLTGQGGYVP